jgi:hypothetical protein
MGLTFLLNMPWQITCGKSSAKEVLVNDEGASTSTALSAKTDDWLKWDGNTRFLIKPVAFSAGVDERRAPRSLALVMAIETSLSSGSASINARTAPRDTSLIFAPALLMTSYRAFSMAFLTPESEVLDPVTNSAINGSIRGVKVMRVPSAFAARVLKTSLEVSANDLANVRCSCGKKGLRNVGIFSRRLFKVNKTAALTSTERSEAARMSGPTREVVKGLRESPLVRSTMSEMASAACVLCSGVPCRRSQCLIMK